MAVYNIGKDGKMINIDGRMIKPQEARQLYNLITKMQKGTNNACDDANITKPRGVAGKA